MASFLLCTGRGPTTPRPPRAAGYYRRAAPHSTRTFERPGASPSSQRNVTKGGPEIAHRVPTAPAVDVSTARSPSLAQESHPERHRSRVARLVQRQEVLREESIAGGINGGINPHHQAQVFGVVDRKAQAVQQVEMHPGPGLIVSEALQRAPGGQCPPP